MARGWESKSVEEQIEANQMARKSAASAASKQTSKTSHPSPKRESLLLAKTRIVKDIATTENQRYRELLEMSLIAIEKQLSEIE